jgi:N-acetylglucosamine-6-sulfatase
MKKSSGLLVKRRTFLRAAAALPLFAMPFARSLEAQTPTGRPNILFVLTDDMPFHELYGMERTRAALAEGGLDYTPGAYCAQPMCGPARVSLLTGLWPHNHGVTLNARTYTRYRTRNYAQNDVLARLKRAGHRLGFFGKFLNDMGSPHDPVRWVHPSFGRSDRWSVLSGGHGDPPSWVNNDGRLSEIRQNHTPYFGARAEGFILNSVGQQPWSCFLHLTDPHEPYTLTGAMRHTHDGERYVSPGTEETDLSDKSKYIRSFKRKAGPATHQYHYEGQSEELELVDLWIGRIFDALVATGQATNTVVVFTSDNGWMHGEHGGLLGKTLPYEESSRLPFYARFPAGLAPRAPGSLVSHLDIPATFVHLAEGEEDPAFDGRSLISTSPRRESLLIENPYWGWYMLREDGADGRLAYIEFPRGERELYDLDTDPYENESKGNAPAEGGRNWPAIRERLAVAIAEAKAA